MDNEAVFSPEHLGEILETDDWDVISEFYSMFCMQLESMLNNESINSDRDSECLRQEAHRMISSCNTVGAFRLSKLFSTLESACKTNTESQLIEDLSGQIQEAMKETLSSIQAVQKKRSET